MVVTDAELLIGNLISKRRDCLDIRHDDEFFHIDSLDSKVDLHS